jgi:chromosome segregation ATPase
MDRRRPLRGKESPKETSDDPVVISLKTASYAKAAAEAERRAENDDRPPSVMSTGKDLPLAPPEMLESDDRVAVLNAKLLGLAHRRNNINRSIQQMTELMPKDRLLESADVQRKREEEKRKVDHLKEELADIQQQEFDLGLKLHRAYKRRDREAEFDSGGTLWIRRITS